MIEGDFFVGAIVGGNDVSLVDLAGLSSQYVGSASASKYVCSVPEVFLLRARIKKDIHQKIIYGS